MPYDPLTAATPGTGLSHVGSYWAATAGDLAVDDGRAPAQVDTDVAIIGGGYTALTPWCLKRIVPVGDVADATAALRGWHWAG